MKNMIIIGATGTVGSQVRGVLNRKQDIQLTLFHVICQVII
nr:hypothetical protein [Holzapfeliella floricola]